MLFVRMSSQEVSSIDLRNPSGTAFTAGPVDILYSGKSLIESASATDLLLAPAQFRNTKLLSPTRQGHGVWYINTTDHPSVVQYAPNLEIWDGDIQIELLKQVPQVIIASHQLWKPGLGVFLDEHRSKKCLTVKFTNHLHVLDERTILTSFF